MKRRLMLYLLGATAAVTGCYAATTTYDPYYYDYAYYDSASYAYDSAYLYGYYDPYGVYYFASTSQAQTAPTDLNAAATSIATQAGTFYAPAGCAQSTASGATVTTVFNNCIGLFGTRAVNGTVTLNLANNNNALVFNATSTGLTIDGRPYNLEFTATGTASGSQRTLNLQSKSRFTDLTDSRTTNGTVTWQQGSNCIVVNGQGSSTRGSITVDTSIEGYTRCAQQCPTAGTVTASGGGGRFTSTFDGTNKMRVVGPDGDDSSYDIPCS